MNYLRDRQIFNSRYNDSHFNSAPKKIFIFIVVLILLWLLLSFFSGWRLGIFSQLATTGNYLEEKVYNTVNILFPSRVLIEENKNLRQKLSLLIVENEKLKTVIYGDIDKNIIEQYQAQAQAIGRIIISADHTFNDLFLLKIDSADGEKDFIGSQARIANYLVIGQVVDQTGRFLRVKSYSSSRLVLNVLVGERREPAQAQGVGNGSWVISLPKGRRFSVGEPVFVSLDSDIFLLGLISQISLKDDDPKQDIYISRPINLRDWPYLELYN